MRIFPISDTHNCHRKLKRLPVADVIAHGGGLTVLLILSLLMLGCESNKPDQKVVAEKPKQQEVAKPRPPVIYLKPYSDFSQQEAKELVPHLRRFLDGCGLSEMNVVVLPNIRLADSLMNDRRSRYRGDKMIRSIPEDGHNAIILLTHKDISVTYKGRPDWGVLGLSLMPKHVCVASDFRLKHKKRDLWKVACHELLHSFFNMQHCPKDDPLCIIKDAKGHADFSKKEHLCKTCMSKLKGGKYFHTEKLK